MTDLNRNYLVLLATKKVLGHLQNEQIPKKIVSKINAELEDYEVASTTIEEIFELAFENLADDSDTLARAVCVQLQIDCEKWARTSEGNWSSDPAGSADRYRGAILALGFKNEHVSAIFERVPYVADRVLVIDDGSRIKWYSDEVRERNNFYWSAYKNLLVSRPTYSEDSIVKLDQETTAIVEQLEDPTEKTFASRGLVVGHVQSGKTSNFAGVVAKAIDAGYRLIVVLSGNTESLRAQTQRRLDMELIGISNILQGRTKESNPDFYEKVDYVVDGNPKFPESFVEHDLTSLEARLAPWIMRLTDSKSDYTKLQKQKMAVINPFDFLAETGNKSVPEFAWENLSSMKVRFLVVKKEKNNLQKVLAELFDNRTELERDVLRRIPALIIDDESDQASVNTKKPDPDSEDDERTAINKLIVGLLGNLSRAQYVGYTATPFANVLIDATDPKDLFPQHFIVPLGKSEGYMGAQAFFDLDPLEEDDAADYAASNRKAFVREWANTDPDNHNAYAMDEESLITAIDSFVLTGALKLWRQANGWRIDCQHHTMLVHYTQARADASEAVKKINNDLWPSLAHTESSGAERLRTLFEQDFSLVSEVRKQSVVDSQGEIKQKMASVPSMPNSFDELIPYISKCRSNICSNGDVAMEVNSNSNNVNFDTSDTWKILVGGNLLSRGFTIEGLTISYFARAAKTQDTLMQMGRWYGYRTGYGDLVRLFLPDKVLWKRATGARKAEYASLCDLFTASAVKEENLRNDLRQYSEVSEEDGFARITPARVPPLVLQAAPELMPVARNKMWNAEISFAGKGGIGNDLFDSRFFDFETNAKHFEAIEFLLNRRSDKNLYEKLFGWRSLGVNSGPIPEPGWVVEASQSEVLLLLKSFRFNEDFRIETDLATIEKAYEEGGIESWKVLIQSPNVGRRIPKVVNGHSINLLKRKRTNGIYGRSTQVVRTVIEYIAGSRSFISPELVAAMDGDDLASEKCATLLLAFSRDEDSTDEQFIFDNENIPSGNVSTLLTYALPYAWAPKGKIGWRAKNASKQNDIVVDSDDEDS